MEGSLKVMGLVHLFEVVSILERLMSDSFSEDDL